MDSGMPPAASPGPAPSGLESAQPEWRPWWVVGDRTRVHWYLRAAAVWTVLAVVSLAIGRFSWVTPLNWSLLAAANGILGLVGLVVMRRRPDLATRPRRPSTTPATICTIGAAVAAAGGVIALEVCIGVAGRTGLGLVWLAAGVAVAVILGVTAHRLKDRAEADGRFASAADPGQPT